MLEPTLDRLVRGFARTAAGLLVDSEMRRTWIVIASDTVGSHSQSPFAWQTVSRNAGSLAVGMAVGIVVGAQRKREL